MDAHGVLGARRASRRAWRRAWRLALLATLGLLAPCASSLARAGSTPPAAAASAKTLRSCRDANLRPTATNIARVNAATLCLVNRIRLAYHLRALRLNRELQGVASGQARDMVIGDYFGDNSISGRTPMQRILATRYPHRARRVASAQNIGWATGSQATPTGIVEAWMHSPPHRAIILTASYHDVGVGARAATPRSLSGGRSGATYTLEFGQRIF